MRRIHLWILASLISSTAGFAAEYPGTASVDNFGETFVQSGICFLRVKGNFRCPKKELRDDDLLINLGAPIVTLNFGGLEEEEDLDATCICEDSANLHNGKWTCACPTPGSGTGVVNYSMRCQSKKTGIIVSVASAPKTFQIKCP